MQATPPHPQWFFMQQRQGPLMRLYSFRLPGLVRGRLHSARSRAMNPRSACASLAVTTWST